MAHSSFKKNRNAASQTSHQQCNTPVRMMQNFTPSEMVHIRSLFPFFTNKYPLMLGRGNETSLYMTLFVIMKSQQFIGFGRIVSPMLVLSCTQV